MRVESVSANALRTRRYYKRHRIKILRKQREHRSGPGREWMRIHCKKRVAAHQELMGAIKMARGCADCGYRAHPAALDFDHLPGTVKLFQVGAMSGRRRELIDAEIAKCEVVCANCHRVRGVDRRRAMCA